MSLLTSSPHDVTACGFVNERLLGLDTTQGVHPAASVGAERVKMPWFQHV